MSGSSGTDRRRSISLPSARVSFRCSTRVRTSSSSASRAASGFIPSRCSSEAPVTVRYGDWYTVCAAVSVRRGMAVVAWSISQASPRRVSSELPYRFGQAIVAGVDPGVDVSSRSVAAERQAHRGAARDVDLRPCSRLLQFVRQLVERLRDPLPVKGAQTSCSPPLRSRPSGRGWRRTAGMPPART